ncbi:hypothetical protein [Parasitella parasitica]|uniref:Uncharacterized protein n=1 Tax=Parasitella parasitica TaxID=35722 RepID=A0A0B7NSK5_9FUNG|nr:hypothetical protein [Parasitella parasitica]
MKLLPKSSIKPTNYSQPKVNEYNLCESKSRFQHNENLQNLDKEKEEYLLRMRQEAYNDLHSQIQTYNNDFIAQMQFIESNQSVPSNESFCSTDTESPEIQSLVDMFQAGTVKDYSQLVEWESYQNPPAYFENQGECGNLW